MSIILGWRHKEGKVKSPRAGPHGLIRCRRAGLTGEAGGAPTAIVTSEAGKFAPGKNVPLPSNPFYSWVAQMVKKNQ